MPFFIDSEGLDVPSVKRRKLSPISNMARYSVQTPSEAGNSPCERDVNLEILHRGPKAQCPDPQATQIKTSDREELIQCIKRGQRPTWVPKPGLEALYAEVNAAEDRSRPSLSRSGVSVKSASTQDFPSQEVETPATTETNEWLATDALRRSLSALHTGDFHQGSGHVSTRGPNATSSARRSLPSAYSISPPSWLAESPTAGQSMIGPTPSADATNRTRAPSIGSSLSSSFVMRVPTSPLVHAINNTSLDISSRSAGQDDSTSSNMARRRTMPPNAFGSLQMSPIDDAQSKFNHVYPPAHHDEAALPQSHKTRRSLSSFTYQPAASPRAASLGKRRPSLASDSSPRQRASMVGSFEESILRGRMSTPPSKPLDFVAQIGVVGKGNCPASLKCPAHVTVPFPAVFYNYPSAAASRSISDDNPSPYVGVIDLEHNLKRPEPPARRTRRSRSSLDPDSLAVEITSPENTAIGKALSRKVQEKKEETSPTPKVPSGGAYRVPQKGQLQIIIKNPNKTAVKLFLVPYDLEGMPSGTKTFVRQRSFSSGPILEAPLAQKQADLAAMDPLGTKDILRYLIHLKFCSTSKGRFYLYDTIRVVFANRVPDGKEKLRNEVQLPDPRFSPYKPAAEGGFRSPSLANGPYTPQTHIGTSSNYGTFENSLHFGVGQLQNNRAQYSMPISLHTSPTFLEEGLKVLPKADRTEGVPVAEIAREVSPVPGFLPSTSSRSSPVPWPHSNGPPMVRGFSPGAVEAGDGLISRKLRELSGGRQE